MQGQWKQISRYYVPSRTPTQVASHAQKHFLRVTGATKRRSRFSTLEDSAIASGLVASQPHQTPGAGGAEASAVGPAQLPGSAQSSGSGWAGPPRQGLNPTTSFPFSAKFVMPPPPDGNGVAVGFPWSKQLPLASTPKGTLPMLRVLPGRLNVTKLVTTTKGYTEEKISVRSPGARTVQKASRRSSPHESNLRAAAQRAMLQQLRERLMAGDNDARRTKRGTEDSPSMSLRSEETSAAHSALDALAGVAAALADSACTL